MRPMVNLLYFLRFLLQGLGQQIKSMIQIPRKRKTQKIPWQALALQRRHIINRQRRRICRFLIRIELLNEHIDNIDKMSGRK